MCISPIIRPNDKFGLPFQPRNVAVPCGKCPECLRKLQNDWFVRSKMQLQVSYMAFFVTLTYDDLYLPILDTGECVLSKVDLVDHFKRLRNKFSLPIKYFACGEYGSESGRPHYHYIFFICKEFRKDRIKKSSRVSFSEDYIDVVRKRVNEAWQLGIITVDYCTDGRIRYVAKYCLKQAAGLEEHSVPPFRLVSQGLGKLAIPKEGFYDPLHPSFVDDGGITYAAPRYIRDKVFQAHPEQSFAYRKFQYERSPSDDDVEFYKSRLKRAYQDSHFGTSLISKKK